MEFAEIAKVIGTVLTQKNKRYGSAYLRIAEFLKILYPNGIQPKDYVHAMLVVRIFDKLMRISQGALNDSFFDIAGYAILGEYHRQSLPTVLAKASKGKVCKRVRQVRKS